MKGGAEIPVTIHAIRTGSVRIKNAQRARERGGLVRVLTSATWTPWLPIYAWLIDHPEGPIVVDTGETASTAEPGYFPRWHPYYRGSVRMAVERSDEIGPQLQRRGVRTRDIATVVLTHFHTDHAGGLHHFPHSRIRVSGDDLRAARGTVGRLQGYLPQHWPRWFDPEPLAFDAGPAGPFDRSARLTRAGDVLAVPSPGHTPGHVSVVVRTANATFFLAGDTSYTEALLVARRPDGVSPRPKIALETMDRILAFAAETPLVYLPSHDPESEARLAERRVVQPAPAVEGAA